MTDAPAIETLLLEITQPTNGQVFVGNAPIAFKGRVVGKPPKTLYYKWYLPDGVDTYTSAQVNVALGAGTHIVTLTAKDVPTDSVADMAKAQTVLMAGGGEVIPDMQTPCIIHVLHAQMIWTTTALYQLNRGNATLYALAAGKWGKEKDGKYTPDPDYQKINRLNYQWTLTPRGNPADRKSATIAPKADKLGFAIIDDANDKKDGKAIKKSVVYYQGKLDVDVGGYTLKLRVEDQQDSSKGHEASQQVEIVG